MFGSLRSRGEGAFVPFLMLGDPGPAETIAAADALIDAGADGLELGIPFSDPVADGPVIQRAAARALAGGTTPRSALLLVRAIRERHPHVPLGLLVYANLVVQKELAAFYCRAAGAGADSVLVADVPAAEAEPFSAAAVAAGIDPVMIVPADATREQVRRVARQARGYTYLLARAGVTGAEREIRPPSAELLGMLAEEGAPPPLVGFGISTPEQVRAAVAAGAAGVISGSAVVSLVERDRGAEPALRRSLGEFARAMKEATRRPRE